MNLNNLITALMIVESSGNDQAIGDNGRALGPLQIHRGVVLDVNRFTGSNYRWESMTNRAQARAVCAAYLTHYVTEKRIGRKPTIADFAKVWNSGPDGFKKTCSDKYAARVQLQTTKQNDNYIEKRKAVPNR